jgi:hypothetical protein
MHYLPEGPRARYPADSAAHVAADSTADSDPCLSFRVAPKKASRDSQRSMNQVKIRR